MRAKVDEEHRSQRWVNARRPMKFLGRRPPARHDVDTPGLLHADDILNQKYLIIQSAGTTLKQGSHRFLVLT